MADDVEFRVISEEEKRKLADNSKIVSEFKQKKLEEEAQKNWDLFYKRNTTNFFKDRHWTTAEFKELLCENSNNEVSIRQTVYIGGIQGHFSSNIACLAGGVVCTQR